VTEQMEIDARGMMCPEPLRMAQLAMHDLAPGAELRITANDPAAPIDFEAWCLRRRHKFLDCEAQRDGWVIRIRKGGQQEPFNEPK